MDQHQVEHITRYLDVNTAMPERASLAFVFGTLHLEPAAVAADLFQRGIVPRTVLTGGVNRRTGILEAPAHLGILLNGGVPRDRIIVESASANTLENVLFSWPKIAACSEPLTIDSIIVVTKWYHCRRAMMTLKRHWPPGILYYGATYEPDGVRRTNWWRSEGGRRRVLKEWRRIPQYLEQGDIAEIQECGDAFV